MENTIIVNVYKVNDYIIYRKRKIPSLDLIPPGYGWEWYSNWKRDFNYNGLGEKWLRKKLCTLTTIPFYKMKEIDLYKDAHGSADLYEYEEYEEHEMAIPPANINIREEMAIPNINIREEMAIPNIRETMLPITNNGDTRDTGDTGDTRDTKCPCYYLFYES